MFKSVQRQHRGFHTSAGHFSNESLRTSPRISLSSHILDENKIVSVVLASLLAGVRLNPPSFLLGYSSVEHSFTR
jgi:hypothetical protein